jgi:hypothetical protein
MIILKGKFVVKSVKKKTSAHFFKDLKVGDVFELEYRINGSYGLAPTVHICQDGKVVHYNNALQLLSNLEKFEVEQVS